MSGVEKVKAMVASLGTYDSPDTLSYFDEDELAKFDVESLELLDTENLGERRWGYDRQTTFRVDGDLVGVYDYAVTGDGDPEGPESWDVYPVEEKTTIRYVQVKEPASAEKPEAVDLTSFDWE